VLCFLKVDVHLIISWQNVIVYTCGSNHEDPYRKGGRIETKAVKGKKVGWYAEASPIWHISTFYFCHHCGCLAGYLQISQS